MKKYIPILALALSFLVLILIVTPASATVRKTGSQGDYFPLTFHFAEGDVPALIDVASINVLFDPSGLSRNPKEDSTAKATPWKHHDIQGLDAPTLEFTSGEPYRLEMDLFFDRYEEGKSVREYTDKIEKLALVNQELHRPPTTRAGSGCVVTWGSKTYTCEVEKTETRFTLFLDDGTSARAAAVTDGGTPVQAIMHIVFEEFIPVADQGKNDGAHKRPGPAKSIFTIPAGDDLFNVVDAGFNVQLPADFFGPGSDPFDGVVICGGGDNSSVDTTIKRLGDIILPPPPSEDTIPIEIVELNLVSCQPITVNTNDGNRQQWDVQISLPPNLAPIVPFPLGEMTIKRMHEDGGTFDSHLSVRPLFTFTKVGNSQEDTRFIDDEITPVDPEFEVPSEPQQPIIGRMYEIVPPAFEFNAQDIPWVRCPEIDSDFCPKLFIYSAENGWLNLELVVPTLPEEGGDSSCDANTDDLARADINKDGLINEEDTELLTLALKSVCSDADNDGVIDSIDNCPLENPQGLDADSDGCTDTIEGLFDTLQSTEIQAGVKNSLLAKVSSALSSLTTERVNAAINQLNAFINQVAAQSGKKISQEDADVLAGFAQNVIKVNDVQLACIQPPSGIIGWWSGDNAFDLINGNNAVLHDDAGFASGKVGNAFNLDGIGDYASIPYSSDLEPSEITVEFWVSGPQMNQQPGNTGGIGVTLLENSAANHEGWSIFVTDPAAYTGGIGVVIGDGTQWHPIISTVGLYHPASGWRHVAMTYDGTYMQLYLDAVPQFGSLGKQVNNAQLSTGRDINIGASWNNGNFARFFKGLIDEVEIYDRALTVTEIQSIYNAGSAGKCKPNVCVAAPSELVGWWTMDDAASSSIANDRAGGNDGTVNGATLGVPGKVSTAADFDGVDDYIEVPDNADLNIADAITIDAWVKLDSLSNQRAIVSNDDVANILGYSLTVGPTGQVAFNYGGVNGLYYTISSITSEVSIGAWHHVAATLDSNADVINIYIDGQLVRHVDYISLPQINPSSGPLLIGRRITTFSQINFDGKIDELEIFNRALSPFEIWAIYNAGTAGKCKTLTPVPGPEDPVE